MTIYTAYALKKLPSLTSTISMYRTKFRVEMTCHPTTGNDTSIQKSLFSNLNSKSHDKRATIVNNVATLFEKMWLHKRTDILTFASEKVIY